MLPVLIRLFQLNQPYIQIQTQMRLQIKIAETGHSQTFDIPQQAFGEYLFNIISTNFKINQKDQAIITKSGHRIKSSIRLDSVLTDQKQDKTIISRDISKFGAQTLPCFFLFNLKDINKLTEPPESQEKKQWGQKLKEELKKMESIRSNIIPFDDIRSLFPPECLEFNAKYVSLFDDVRKCYVKLEYEYRQLQQIHDMIYSLQERCENQRRSIDSLCSNVGSYATNLKERTSKLLSQKQALKKGSMIDDKSLRQNSGCFQMKKKQENLSTLHQEKINQLKIKVNSTLQDCKKIIKASKSKYQPISKKIVQYQNLQIKEKINTKLSNSLSKYNQMINYFRTYTETKDEQYLKKIEQEFSLLKTLTLNDESKENKEYLDLRTILTDYYFEFCEMNEHNRFFGRQNYTNLIKCKEQVRLSIKEVNQQINSISQLFDQDHKFEKQVSSYSEKNLSQVEEPSSFFSKESQNSLQSFKTTIKTEAEIKRRVKFYQKLIYIQSLANKICTQEQGLRKKYQQDCKNNIFKKQYLSNIKVPEIDIDLDGTTDFQLFKANNNPSKSITDDLLSAQEFMVLEYQSILEKINRMPGINHQEKTRNMQQILKSVSDIFYKIYHHKNQELNQKCKEITEKNTSLSQKIKCIEQEMQEKKQMIEKMSQDLKEKQNEIVLLVNNKNEEIRKEKNKYDKSISQNKQLRIQLKKQLKINEVLQNQLTLGEQQLEELKMILAEKQVQNIRLEQENLEKSTTKDFVSQEQSKSHKDSTQLKEVVIQNLGKQIESNKPEDQSQVIMSLKKDINFLRQQNQILRDESQAFQKQKEYFYSELQKCMKETEEEQVQVDILSESVQLKSQHLQNIRIGEDIIVGQTAIFMPFNNRLYVGVWSRDEDRTLCHVSNTHHSNYILDIDSFNSKTRELLSECSFLVVLKVEKMNKDSTNYVVEGKIEYLLGFQDDNLTIKNYASFLMI